MSILMWPAGAETYLQPLEILLENKSDSEWHVSQSIDNDNAQIAAD